ncbi:MAG TPA: slipin family protein [Candidatus Acidoferrales bacterium]|nr:slipin family protein [Candidatus Acidoferrales bacterium]
MEAGWLIAAVVLFLIWLFNCIKILNEWERGVVLRLGRMLPVPKGPGLILILWPIDRLMRISLRLITLDVPPQDAITRDNVTVRVNAVAYFRVMDPNRMVVTIEGANYLYATSQLAQLTLRDVIGQVELDTLLAERDKVNARLQEILDEHTDPWGIKVSIVQVKAVDLPQEMQRAIAKQAEAERERRAKIIHAEGESQAAQRLADAAKTLATEPAAIQLRYLQTLTEIGIEKNTTVIFPVPIDIISNWARKSGQG